MASSVVFPDPEGPTMATHSPWCTVMCTLESAWVSTSSVRNTLVTPSRWSSRCPAAGGRLGSLAGLRSRSSEPHGVARIPCGHVGEDHPVTLGQPALHLDGVDAAPPERDLGALGVVASREHPVELHRALG